MSYKSYTLIPDSMLRNLTDEQKMIQWVTGNISTKLKEV